MVSARRVSGGWALLLVVLALASVATQVHGASWARTRLQQVLNPTPSSSSPSTAAVAAAPDKRKCPYLATPAVAIEIPKWTNPASNLLREYKPSLPPTADCPIRYKRVEIGFFIRNAWMAIVGGGGSSPNAAKVYSHVASFGEPNTEFVGAASRGCASKLIGTDPNGPGGLFPLTKAQFDAFKIHGLVDDRFNVVSNIFAAVNMQFHCRVNSGRPLDKSDAAALPLKVDIAGFKNPYGPTTATVVAPSSSTSSTPVKPAVSTPPVVPIPHIAPPPSKPAAAAA